jgi:mono/diheme cytochrome c family protein
VDFARRDEYLRPNHEIATGRSWVTDAGGAIELDANGQPKFTYVERIPVPVDMDLLKLGQKKFDIMCMPCHGMTGMGDGMVGRNWAYALPNFHDAKYQPGGELGQDGYIFNVIRNGVPNPGGNWERKMPSYARKLSIEETWAVVSYFRALQLHRKGSPAMLSPTMRQQLEQKRASAGVVGSAAPKDGGKEGSS